MASRNPDQPNLLFMLSDDQGAWAMGCAGNDEIISRPGHVPENQVSRTLLSQYDWLPTMVDYAGGIDRVPEGLPGRSFAPLLRGESMGERESIFVFDEYGPVRMIRSREWKLIWRYPAGAHELYNVAEDPGERVNLFNKSGLAGLIKELRRELDEWYATYVDPSIDGSRVPITGYGQRERATVEDAFNYRWLMKDPEDSTS